METSKYDIAEARAAAAPGPGFEWVTNGTFTLINSPDGVNWVGVGKDGQLEKNFNLMRAQGKISDWKVVENAYGESGKLSDGEDGYKHVAYYVKH